ncbi:ankyrin protein [Fusarium denticulatum]|uniref:Ankyrin protein n=1 Tax=Fusarium denticulatum TaxID=48507 RepID=A0A8H5X7X3_9HYPO|nr:ankyrin protein [Fusarium denticulatum]
MEVTGLAVGVVGLAGLFSVCLDSLSRFQTYRESNSETHVLDMRFRAARARFEQWGVSVGISNGRLQPDHHHELDNRETANLIESILQIIAKTMCDESILQRSRTGPRLQSGQLGGLSQSRGKRLEWALGGKESRIEQVDVFEKLVQQLYNLVPPDEKSHNYEGLESIAWVEDIRRMLTKIEKGIKNTPVAHFFSHLIMKAEKIHFSALRSWHRQVAARTNAAFECTRRVWENDSSEQASRKTLVDLLKQVVKTVPGCVFIANGLDECSQLGNGDASVARFLRAIMVAIKGANARLLLVSRDEPEIREALGDHKETWSEYRIGTNDVQADTAVFSQSVVGRKLQGKSEHLWLAISEAMTDKCQGQFLWIQMREQSLRNTMSKKRLQEVVKNTPSGLDRLYDQTWIIKTVLIDQFEKLDPDDYPENVDDDYITGEILGLCGPLVEVHNDGENSSPEYRTLHVPHFSVRQYLVEHLPAPLWMQPKDIINMECEMIHHTAIARSCIRYLSLPQVWEEDEDRNLYPKSLLFYAAFVWVQQANLGFMDPSLRDLSKAFLKRNNVCYSSLVNYIAKCHISRSASKSYLQPQLRPFEFVLYRGWTDMADHLFDDAEVNEIGALGRAPIFSACLSGSAESVNMLIRHGADLSITDILGLTCLHAAALRAFEDIVRILVESNVDLSAQDKIGTTPLLSAAEGGSMRCYQYLLEQGADVRIRNMDGGNVIHHACLLAGHTEVLRFILQNGPDTLATDDLCSLGSPLMFVAENGDIDMAKVLFEFGAVSSLFIQSRSGELSLQVAASSGHIELVELFLEHGAATTLSIPNNDGDTALNFACAVRGLDKIVSLLLRPGVEESILMENEEGNTPLHVASRAGHASYIRLILQYSEPEHQRLLEIQNKKLRTPLCLVSALGNIAVVRELLNFGARTVLSVSNEMGETPLFLTALVGDADVVRTLLEYDAENPLDILEACGSSALWAATVGGSSEVVKELLSSGTGRTILASNKLGETLHVAAFEGNVEILKRLLEVPGVSVNQKTSYGLSPLFIPQGMEITAW